MISKFSNLKKFLKVLAWTFKEDYEEYWKYSKSRLKILLLAIGSLLFILASAFIQNLLH